MLRNATKQALSLIGKKAVHLAILKQHFEVPPAFIITSQAFQNFLNQSGINNKIKGILRDVNKDDQASIAEASNRIKELIVSADITDEIFEEIKETYHSMNIDKTKSIQEMMEQDDIPVVAVRPSPVGYDEKDMHTSILNIRGTEHLKKALLLCWASFYSTESIEWQLNHPERKNNLGFAVILQKMIDSQSAGELHTEYWMNPEEVLIRACKGLGSALSSGLIMPDKYFITKESLNIANIEVGKQTFMLERDIDTDKTTKIYLQDNYSKKQKVADRHIGELTLMSKKIESMFGKPQVVDFAIHKNNIYLLGTYEPAWHKEKLAEEIEEKRKPQVPNQEEPTEDEIKQKQEEICYGITEELDKDELVNSVIKQPVETQQDEQVQEKQETQNITEMPKQEEIQQHVMDLTAEDVQQAPKKEVKVEQGQPESPENQEKSLSQDNENPEEIEIEEPKQEDKEYETKEMPVQSTMPFLIQPKNFFQRKVEEMSQAVMEIQKPKQPEQPETSEYEEHERKEEEILQKLREQKGEIDINDLVMSIDPDELEKHMNDEAEKSAQEQIEQSKEVKAPEQIEQPRSKIVTEPVQEEAKKVVEEETKQEKKKEPNQQPELPRELSTIEKASGNIIIQCFKEYKSKIPQEQWATNPELRHLAVLTQNFTDNKIPPTKEQIQYALDAMEKLNS